MQNQLNIEDADRSVQCVCCGKILPRKAFKGTTLKKNAARIKCRYCEWIETHKNNLPIVEGWSAGEINRVLQFILNKESIYINDLQIAMPNRELKELCQLYVTLKLHIQTLYVKTTCYTCGNSTIKFARDFAVNNHSYCNTPGCKGYRPTGKDSPFYKRIITTCANCGQTIEVIPFTYNLTNAASERHNFCSKQCYSEFRSKYYIGEKSAQYGVPMPDHTKDCIRENLISRIDENQHLNSNIQLLTNSILDDMGIKYEREKQFRFYAGDNYLTDYNLLIEVMGSYWHVSPLRYGKNGYPISEKQHKWIVKDKEKHTYIKRYYNIDILYLWETDIKKNPDLCRAFIQAYIDNQGNLSNYHSFNYHLENNQLVLNQELIIPYQDQSKQDYICDMQQAS